MNNFYVAAKCNPVDFLLRKTPVLDTEERVKVCADMNDVIDYLDSARMPESRADAMFSNLQLCPVDVIVTVQQLGNAIHVAPGAPHDTMSSVLQHMNIQAIDVKLPQDSIFGENTYHFSRDRASDYAETVHNDICARAIILHEAVNAFSQYPAVPNVTMMQWYRDIAQTVLSPVSLSPLPTPEWTALFAQKYQEIAHEHPEMNQMDLSALSRMNTTEQLLGRAIGVGESAILSSMLKGQQVERDRVIKNMLERNFMPEKYLETLLKMMPKEDQPSFQAQYLAWVDKYQTDNPGEPAQNAALFSGASLAKSMSFVYFQAGDHQTQMAFDEIQEKCNHDMSLWQKYESEIDEQDISID